MAGKTKYSNLALKCLIQGALIMWWVMAASGQTFWGGLSATADALREHAEQSQADESIRSIFAKAKAAEEEGTINLCGFYTGMAKVDADALAAHYGLKDTERTFLTNRETLEVYSMHFTLQAIRRITKGGNSFNELAQAVANRVGSLQHRGGWDEPVWYEYKTIDGVTLKMDERNGCNIHDDPRAREAQEAKKRTEEWFHKATEQKDALALDRLRKAAEQGSAAAQYYLGWMVQKGLGVKQDDAEAVKWYRKAAEQGDDDGQVDVGWMYYNGQGVEQSYTEALKWFRKAAEQGNVGGQNNLGRMYHEGRGTEQDDAVAVEWFRKGAEQGDAVAQRSLGILYDNGQGVEQNYTEALKWYRKATEQGDARAFYRLGVMYEQGRGVEQSNAKATALYRKAADQGDDDAAAALQRLGL